MNQELIFHVFSSSQSKLVVFGLLVGADHLLQEGFRIQIILELCIKIIIDSKIGTRGCSHVIDYLIVFATHASHCSKR